MAFPRPTPGRFLSPDRRRFGLTNQAPAGALQDTDGQRSARSLAQAHVRQGKVARTRLTSGRRRLHSSVGVACAPSPRSRAGADRSSRTRSGSAWPPARPALGMSTKAKPVAAGFAVVDDLHGVYGPVLPEQAADLPSVALKGRLQRIASSSAGHSLELEQQCGPACWKNWLPSPGSRAWNDG
jgi:hypothetical protein